MGTRKIITSITPEGVVIGVDAPDACSTAPISSTDLSTTPATYRICLNDPLTGAKKVVVPGVYDAAGNLGPALITGTRLRMRLVAGNNQTGAALATLSTPLQVQVFNAGGTTAAGVIVEWADTTSNPDIIVATSTTGSTGTTTYSWVLGAQAGTVELVARVRGEPNAQVVFTATIGAVSGSGTVQAVSVTTQTAVTSAVVGAPPSVLVLDATDNPIVGETITFAVTAGSGVMVPSNGIVTSDANGLATLTSWTMGASAGTNTVTATNASYTGSPLSFGATAVAALPTQIIAQAGTPQTGVTAGAAATAFTARVKTAGGAGVQTVTVSWAILSSAGGSLNNATSVTDASGDATCTLTSSTTVKTTLVQASFPNAAGTLVTVNFSVTTVAGASTKWVMVTQPASNVVSGIPFSQQPIVKLTDVNDNLVTTAGVVCTAARASGSDTLAGTLTATTVNGVATFTNLQFNAVGAGGANTIQFTGGSKTAVTSATVSVSAPIPVALLWGTQPSGTTTGITMVSCTVRVVDNANATVPAATNAVALTLVGSGGVLTGTTTVNAVAGVATFSALIVTGTGTYSFSATSGAFPAVLSSSFTISASLGSAWPNQPAGYTPFLGASGKVLVSGATQLTQTTIAWKDASTYTPPTTTLGVSLAAPGVPPTSDTNLAQITLPYHYTSGNGHGTIYETPNLSNLSAKRLYMACYAKVSENWYGQSAGILKFFQPLTGTTGGTNRIILSIHGAGNATLKAKLGFQFGSYTGGVINGVAQSSSTTYYSPAGSTGTIVRGQWHLYELLVIANTAGNADGTVQVWLDGVQTHGFIGNNRWDSTGFSWQNAQIQSVYGGPTVANAVPDDQYIWVASPFFVSTHA